ncbi:MAG TPA: hypothetical protein DCL66_14215 [Gammaproteobacteria bacterium]|nr:hypothetical protein [Gammaproteobacteria bacterium]
MSHLLSLKLGLMLRLSVISLIFTLSSAVLAATEDIEQEFDVSSGGTLIMDSDAGSIKVESWNRDQVLVRISNPDGFDVNMTQKGDSVFVSAESEGRGFFRSSSSNISFRVSVPKQYSVELETGGGPIEVADLIGNVTVDTSGGSIQIGKISGGDVKADTSGGSIDIQDVDGNVEADTSGGRITIGNVTGDVIADTSGGGISIGNVQGDMFANTSGGHITVGQGAGRVELDTSGGTIRAGWALGPIIVDTSGGNIILEGSETSVKADTSGGNITVEKSNGSVDADTSGGSITIRKSVGPIRADTAGGRIDAELVSSDKPRAGAVELETAGGDVTIRIPSSMSASIYADLAVSRRGRGDYRIYTDFPLIIQEDDRGNIVGQGDINGGGSRIYLETTNSDITILSVK